MNTPVAHGLKRHLELLTADGYKVITTSELLKISPFEDIDTSADYMDKLRALEGVGQVIGYRDNTFKPNNYLTFGEMMTMTLKKSDYQQFMKDHLLKGDFKKEYRKYPYFVAYHHYKLVAQIHTANAIVKGQDLMDFMAKYLNKKLELKPDEPILRKDYIHYL